jgi:hypothetical protein
MSSTKPRSTWGALGIDALPRVCDMGQTACVAPVVEQVIAKLGPRATRMNYRGIDLSIALLHTKVYALQIHMEI